MVLLLLLTENRKSMSKHDSREDNNNKNCVWTISSQPVSFPRRSQRSRRWFDTRKRKQTTSNLIGKNINSKKYYYSSSAAKVSVSILVVFSLSQDGCCSAPLTPPPLATPTLCGSAKRRRGPSPSLAHSLGPLWQLALSTPLPPFSPKCPHDICSIRKLFFYSLYIYYEWAGT